MLLDLDEFCGDGGVSAEPAAANSNRTAHGAIRRQTFYADTMILMVNLLMGTAIPRLCLYSRRLQRESALVACRWLSVSIRIRSGTGIRVKVCRPKGCLNRDFAGGGRGNDMGFDEPPIAGHAFDGKARMCLGRSVTRWTVGSPPPNASRSGRDVVVRVDSRLQAPILSTAASFPLASCKRRSPLRQNRPADRHSRRSRRRREFLQDRFPLWKGQHAHSRTFSRSEGCGSARRPCS